MQKVLPWLLRLFGPALLALFLYSSWVEGRLGDLYTNLAEADLWPIIWSLLLLPPFLIIKAWRWQRLLRAMALDLPLHTAVGLYIVGIFLGQTTPGQAGDLVKAWYLQDRGQPIAPALLSVVLDRLFDLLVMAALAPLGIFALGRLLPNRELQTLLVLAMGLGLTILTTLLVARGPRQWLMTRALPLVLPQRLTETLAHWNKQLAVLKMSPRLVTVITIASLISAFFTFYRLWLLFIAIRVTIPLYIVVGISALIAVLQVLPISIAGVGVRDVVLIAALIPYGYTQEQAIAVSALFLLINLQHILVGFIVSFWFPLGKVCSATPDIARQTE
jgi:uncharacterized protein (TIRG00374 family)